MRIPHPITGEIQVWRHWKYERFISFRCSWILLTHIFLRSTRFPLSSRSTMTGTSETWSSTSCRLETWPRGTTTATLTPLSRSTSCQGEGELRACLSLSRNVWSLSPFLLLCLSCFLSPYFFLTLYRLCCMELTNYLSLYERMRPDMMTWGSQWWCNLMQSLSINGRVFKTLYSAVRGDPFERSQPTCVKTSFTSSSSLCPLCDQSFPIVT